MDDGPEWFAPKRFGYGAGLPISWQGWAIILAYVALVSLIAFRFGKHSVQLIAALIPLTATFLVICARTTKGGWHWRWGDEDAD